MKTFLIVFVAIVGVCAATTNVDDEHREEHLTNVGDEQQRVRKSWDYTYARTEDEDDQYRHTQYVYQPTYETDDVYRGYRSAYHHEAPVHAGPAKAYTYPSPAPKVKCPSSLLLSCQPNVAHVPCVSPPAHSYSHGKY